MKYISRADDQCAFSGQYGNCKDDSEPGSKFCFWHDPDIDKTGADVKQKLEVRAATGIPMEGFNLQKSNLDNIDLVHHHDEQSYKLINSDLSRASLCHGHLYRVDLTGSKLLKANLSNANLHRANLDGCNLLGVTLHDTMLDHVQWGTNLYQEKQAKIKPNKAIVLYEEAEESARNIRRHCENHGMTQIAGYFYYKERVFQRLQMPKYSLDRLISFLLDKISCYGESPFRVVIFSMALIVFSSFIYWFVGISDGNTLIQFDGSLGISHNLSYFLDCIYFSVVTFTTLGYGDLTPTGISRFIAACEAFIGSFSLALFVVLFVKKMIR